MRYEFVLRVFVSKDSELFFAEFLTELFKHFLLCLLGCFIFYLLR